jgi:hypothetical protein
LPILRWWINSIPSSVILRPASLAAVRISRNNYQLSSRYLYATLHLLLSEDIFIVHPATTEQANALKAFVKVLKIKFEVTKEKTYNPALLRWFYRVIKISKTATLK